MPKKNSGLTSRALRTCGALDQVAGENRQEDHALQYRSGGVGKAEPSLHQPTARGYSADQKRHRNDGEWVVPGEKGDEDAGITVARDQRPIGAAVNSGDFNHSGKPGAASAKRASDQHQPRHWQTLQLRRARIAARHSARKAEARAIDQDPEGNAGDDADCKTRMDVGAGERAQHVDVADRRGRWLVQAGRIA
jgi:hypothetical protein